MKSKAIASLPSQLRVGLEKLGREVAIARKRRNISMRDMAERIRVSPATLVRLEKGDPSVGIGILVACLWILGMQKRLLELLSPETDSIGIREEIARLPKKIRKKQKDTGFSF